MATSFENGSCIEAGNLLLSLLPSYAKIYLPLLPSEARDTAATDNIEAENAKKLEKQGIEP